MEPALDLSGVGENLQDHIRIQISYQLLSNYTSFDVLRYNTTYANEQLALYNSGQRSLYQYTGSEYAFMNWKQVIGDDSKLQSLAKQAAKEPVTSSPYERLHSQNLLDYLAHDRTNNVPQVEMFFSDGYSGVKGYPAAGSSLYGQDFFSLFAAIQHPFGLGSVHIASSSITTPPRINPNYLVHEYDLEAIVTAAKHLRKIANTAPLSQIWSSEYEPGLNVVGDGLDSEQQWRSWATNNMLTIYHPAGTCAMLPKDKGGVVDPNLKVYGTTNVRVVDASIIPSLVSGHIQTAVYGIAERAAEIIIKEWKR